MKRPGDMRRRRQAAYRRGWAEAMNTVASRIESLRASGRIVDGHALVELKRLAESDPPDPNDEPGGGHEHRVTQARGDLRP